MLSLLSLIFNKNKKNVNNKVTYTLLHEKRFKYLKTIHPYHYVDPHNIRKCVLYLFLCFVL